MNIKHSVNVPARSMLRSLVTAATMGALMLGVVSASADGGGGRGKYSLVGSASGGIGVKGTGRFQIRDVDGKLIFNSKVGGCSEITMDDGRQDHTCKPTRKGSDGKIEGMKEDSVAKLVVEKSAIKFPEAGKSSSGTAKGTVHFLEKSSEVKIDYTISESGGKYKVSKAEFAWDYTKHTNKVCLAVVCVKPEFKITVTDAEIDAKK